MKLTLVVIGGKQAGMEIPIAKQRILIGRSAQCQMRLGDGMVSGEHCVLLRDNGYFAIEDCGSATGTFVNGEYIQERRWLSHGDRIRIGALVLEVRLAVIGDGQWNPQTDIEQGVAVRPVAAENYAAVQPVVAENYAASIPGRFDQQAPGPWASVPQPLSAPLALQNLSPHARAIPVDRPAFRPHNTQEKELPRQKQWNAVDLLLLAIVGILGVWPRCVVTTLMVVSVALLSHYSRPQQGWNIGGWRIRFRLETIDLVLTGAFIGLVCIGELLFHWSPSWWPWYIGVLDLRNWSLLAWMGVAAMWAVVLLSIRFWP